MTLLVYIRHRKQLASYTLVSCQEIYAAAATIRGGGPILTFALLSK